MYHIIGKASLEEPVLDLTNNDNPDTDSLVFTSPENYKGTIAKQYAHADFKYPEQITPRGSKALRRDSSLRAQTIMLLAEGQQQPGSYHNGLYNWQ